jgi:hypothetical protein
MERSDGPLIIALVVAVFVNSVAAFVTSNVAARNFFIVSGVAILSVNIVLIWVIPRVFPRRFANLVFVIDDAGNMVVINHPVYKKLNPPGSRLRLFEAPHEAIGRVLHEELGLEDQPGVWRLDEEIHPPMTTFQVRLAPRPFQVQVEPGKHRRRVREHVDFIYVCRIKGVRPPLNSASYSPTWVSYDEFLKLPEHLKFTDVPQTFHRILGELNLLGGHSARPPARRSDHNSGAGHTYIGIQLHSLKNGVRRILRQLKSR